MLPDVTLPLPAAVLLKVFRPCFTAPTFRTFRVLVAGFLAQAGCRSVCGMPVGAGLSRWWPHDRLTTSSPGPRAVQVVLIRDKNAAGYDLALVSTDLTAGPAQIIERYAARWSVEVAFEDAKQIFGAGDARNRKASAVRRAVPSALACQGLTMIWHATAGHHDADLAARREQQPWYTSKTQPSTADMIAKLRHVLIAARYRPSRPDQPTPAEIHTLRLAWEDMTA
jgi:hypothetical protein